MSPEEAVLARLRAAAAVTDRVGAGAAARIYFEEAPPGATAPYIVYTVVSEVPEKSFTHVAGGTRGCRVQVDSWALSSSEARALADAVEAALVDVITATFSATLDSQRSERDRTVNLYGRSSDYLVGLS